MPIYEIASDAIHEVKETTFGAEKIREREDLQRLLRTQIDIISEGTLIIAEEYSEWADSKRRIDLLGLDKQANLVVFELKRTEDGGHMELQAIRYAAMVSTMTFDQVADVYANHLKNLQSDADARVAILEHLDWDEPNEAPFNHDVRIVLVSAEFSKELTTAVLWLNDRELDIRCVRIKPYKHKESLLVDVQQVIPLPEATDYRVKEREKRTKERIAREFARDFTKFDVNINGVASTHLAKRQAILRVVKHLCTCGVTPEQISALIPWHRLELFQSTSGKLDSATFVQKVSSQSSLDAKELAKRYFCGQDDLLMVNDRTFAFSNQWGTRTKEAIDILLAAYPNKGITCAESDAD